ncbi:SDR family NAD(P)-dependent oxidoreductase [Microbacterium sp.]|uniref:SDR family NAD(P)-dependent oxidoreductase n=1 Tax=Microbacterium sp. TaxID=51671 RepID=UPI003F9A05A6
MTFSNDALQGKVAVVTGAARGIGRATAIALARAGADVVGIDIVAEVVPGLDFAPATAADLDATGAAVAEAGSRWVAAIADIRDIARLREVAADTVTEWGGIDIVFANAGIQTFDPLLGMTDEQWSGQVDNNLTGTANTLRAFAPHLVERGGGRIVVTSSTQGQHGTKFGASYSATKWGIIGLMKSAALELGEHDITVNALIPGLIDTALTRHETRYGQLIEAGGHTPTGDEAKDEATAVAARTPQIPLGVPWVEPEDVAPAVVFLASDAARMITGTSLAVTAGDSANITA